MVNNEVVPMLTHPVMAPSSLSKEDKDAVFERGDVVFIRNEREVDEKNHVICGNHPAVIVQNDIANTHSPNLVVCYMTSQLKRLELPGNVVLQHYKGLKPSVVLTEQIATVPKTDVLGYITHLRYEDQVRVNRALAESLQLKIET